jgi:hypothetical protein
MVSKLPRSPPFLEAGKHSPVVLRLCRPQLTDLGRLAVAVAGRRVVVAVLAPIVLLEDSVVVLEQRRHVVPEGRRQLGRRVGVVERRAVGVLDRVELFPCGIGLVGRRRDVGVVDGHVEHTKCLRVDVVDTRLCLAEPSQEIIPRMGLIVTGRLGCQK